jgi:predicted YcjX-like family ATPase
VLQSNEIDWGTGLARRMGARIADFVTPNVRLGVTGLARSGKTVFITALVRNLLAGGRLPFFAPMAEGRITRAYLEPQPDDTLPRFAYEDHLAALAKDPPEWPESTRRISQLRVTVEYESTQLWRRTFTPGRLHIDIVDYPGEWLTDLPLLEMDFAAWSAASLEQFKAPHRAKVRPGVADLAALDPDGPADEQVALRGAAEFTRTLEAARSADPALAVPGPGRFLLPGDLEGSPLLTFFPLVPRASGYVEGSLGAMLARRYESYKTHVVKPFFRNHFARLDRQIVLIDALSAVNAGGYAVADLERTLTSILQAFRPGQNTWLWRSIAPRIDRVVFAATKADHLHHTDHDRLEAILRHIAAKAIRRAEFAEAEVKVLALSALRATREAEARSGRDLLPCIVGVPLPGERVGSKVFDGKKEAAVFPGDLPAEPELAMPGIKPIELVRFRPPRLAPETVDTAWPHVRLDRAMEFLLGDWLT